MTNAPSSEWSLTPGAALGNWRIVAPLGAGSFAEVYKAQHYLTTRRWAAIKVLRPSRIDSSEARRRFLQEADCLNEIQSPNVVRFYDVATTADGGVWIAMEYLEGQSLYDLCARSGQLDPVRALNIAASIADGVQAAHAIGLIHRDLKEENIFITTQGVVKVLDFGVAKLKNPELSGHAKATAANMVIGTLTHLAPEQVNGEGASPQSDIYALGIILYTMITGRHPCIAPGEEFDLLADLAVRIILSTPIAPRSLAPHITPEIEFLLYAALAKAPGDRYASMIAFKGAIVQARDNYQAGRPAPGFSPSALQGALERASYRDERFAAQTPPPGPVAAPPGPAVSSGVAPSCEPVARPTRQPARQPVRPRKGLVPWWLGLTTVVTVAIAVALVVRPDWVRGVRQALRLAPPAPSASAVAAQTAAPSSMPMPSPIPPVSATPAATPSASPSPAEAVSSSPSAPAAAEATAAPPARVVPSNTAATRASAPATRPAAKPAPAVTTSAKPTSVIIDPWADSPE